MREKCLSVCLTTKPPFRVDFHCRVIFTCVNKNKRRCMNSLHKSLRELFIMTSSLIFIYARKNYTTVEIHPYMWQKDVETYIPCKCSDTGPRGKGTTDLGTSLVGTKLKFVSNLVLTMSQLDITYRLHSCSILRRRFAFCGFFNTFYKKIIIQYLSMTGYNCT